MIDQTLKRLEDLAHSDPAVAPLAMLQAEALRASADPSWARGVPTLEARRLGQGIPLLHGHVLTVGVEQARSLLQHLAALARASRVGQTGAEDGVSIDQLRHALADPSFDLLALLHAGITQDKARTEHLAAQVGVEDALLSALAQVAILPLLQACGRQAPALLEGIVWERGYCPVCAAWPAIAELRGLDRQRILRCGRCGAGWLYRHQQCPFCANDDHRTQGYLAAEGQLESRRVETCDRCRSYLKTFATIGGLAAADILVQDLTSLELDIAALEREYARPGIPGFKLEMRLEPPGREHGKPVH